MSSILRLKPGAWPAQALTPEAAVEVINGGAARGDAAEDMARTTRRLAWVVGVGGALIGVAGLAVGAYVLTTAEPPRHHFSTIDPSTGNVSAAVSATDAPKLFSKGTSHQYLRKFVETCAAYNHEMRQQNYNRCTALMAPQAMAKYHDSFTASNPESPQNKIGAAATLTPENLRYEPFPTNTGNIQSWVIRYAQVQRRNGQVVARHPWAVTVHFEWRPEMRMTEEKRAWNTAGMRVVDFHFGADVPR